MKGTAIMSLEHSDISMMLEVATVAARLAGQRAMEDIKYITPEIKNGSEIVTQADRNCQKIIIDRIKESLAPVLISWSCRSKRSPSFNIVPWTLLQG